MLSGMQSALPGVYALQGDSLTRFNANWQIINNTYASEITNTDSYSGYGGVDLGSSVLTSQSLSQGMMTMAHTGLDALGIVPALGEAADGANAALYAYEGDY